MPNMYSYNAFANRRPTQQVELMRNRSRELLESARRNQRGFSGVDYFAPSAGDMGAMHHNYRQEMSRGADRRASEHIQSAKRLENH